MTAERQAIRLRVLALDEDTFHELLGHVDMRLPRHDGSPTPRFIRRLAFENMAKRFTLDELNAAVDDVQGANS